MENEMKRKILFVFLVFISINAWAYQAREYSMNTKYIYFLLDEISGGACTAYFLNTGNTKGLTK